MEIKKKFEKKTIETRLASKAGKMELTRDAGKIVETELLSLSTKLYSDLSSEIFDEKTMETVECL